MSAELAASAGADGGTVVDLSCHGPRRQHSALPHIAQETGLHIVIGTGLYAPRFYPSTVRPEAIEDLAARFVREVEQSVAGTAMTRYNPARTLGFLDGGKLE